MTLTVSLTVFSIQFSSMFKLVKSFIPPVYISGETNRQNPSKVITLVLYGPFWGVPQLQMVGVQWINDNDFLEPGRFLVSWDVCNESITQISHECNDLVFN